MQVDRAAATEVRSVFKGVFNDGRDTERFKFRTRLKVGGVKERADFPFPFTGEATGGSPKIEMEDADGDGELDFLERDFLLLRRPRPFLRGLLDREEDDPTDVDCGETTEREKILVGAGSPENRG